MNYGSIRLSTNPVSATVSINNLEKGTTPLDIINVMPGIYNITLTYSGMHSYNFDTVVIDGKMTIVEFDFFVQEVVENHIDLVGTDLVAVSIPPGMTVEEPPNMPDVPGGSGTGTSRFGFIDKTIETPPSNVPTAGSDTPTSDIGQYGFITDETGTTSGSGNGATSGQSGPAPGMPEQAVPATLDDVVGVLGTISDNIVQQNTNLTQIDSDINAVKDSITLSSNRVKDQKWYDAENLILVSVPVKPEDNNSILYQYENINNVLGRNSGELDIVNEGPGILYIVTSIDGLFFKNEVTIFEGQKKTYNDLYTVGLRSPTANLLYKVTERKVTTVSGQQFSGSRFKDRRDRKGVIVFQDDYESPTLKFITDIIGAGTVARSTDTAYSDDFSLKMVTGANPGDHSDAKYFHTDFHGQKVGIQVQFASASDPYDITMLIQYSDGTNVYGGNVFVTTSTSLNISEFYLIDESGTPILLKTDNNVTSAITAWNSMKLVIDISTKKFVSSIINGTKIDLSVFNLAIVPAISTKFIQTFVGVIGASAGSVAIAYLDNYIFSEDET